MARETLGRAVLILEGDDRQLKDKLAATSVRLKDIGAKAAIAGAAITGFFAVAVKMASDVTESLSAMQAVYGDLSIDLDKFAQDNIDVLKLSRAEFGQLAAQTGALLKNFGMDADQAAAEFKDLSFVAADMASVFDKDVDQALAAISSGLRGETEPLRTFGVDMTDATISAYAMSEGITKSVSSMTMAEKIQLRLGSLYQQTAQVQGEAARTAGNLASQMRIARASGENTAAMMGEALLPAVEAFMDVLIPVIAAVGEWMRQNPELTKWLVIAAAAIGGVLLVGGGLLILMSALITAFTVVAPVAIAAWVAITGPVGLIIAGIVLIVAGLAALYFKFDEVRAVVHKVWEAVKAVFGWIVDTVKNSWDMILAVLFPPIGLPLLIARKWGKITDIIYKIFGPLLKLLGIEIPRAIDDLGDGADVPIDITVPKEMPPLPPLPPLKPLEVKIKERTPEEIKTLKDGIDAEIAAIQKTLDPLLFKLKTEDMSPEERKAIQAYVNAANAEIERLRKLKIDLELPNVADMKARVKQLENEIEALQIYLQTNPNLPASEIARVNAEILKKQKEIVRIKILLGEVESLTPEQKKLAVVMMNEQIAALEKEKNDILILMKSPYLTDDQKRALATFVTSINAEIAKVRELKWTVTPPTPAEVKAQIKTIEDIIEAIKVRLAFDKTLTAAEIIALNAELLKWQNQLNPLYVLLEGFQKPTPLEEKEIIKKINDAIAHWQGKIDEINVLLENPNLTPAQRAKLAAYVVEVNAEIAKLRQMRFDIVPPTEAEVKAQIKTIESIVTALQMRLRVDTDLTDAEKAEINAAILSWQKWLNPLYILLGGFREPTTKEAKAITDLANVRIAKMQAAIRNLEVMLQDPTLSAQERAILTGFILYLNGEIAKIRSQVDVTATFTAPTQADIQKQIAELERNIDELTVKLISDPSLSNDEIAAINKEIASKQSQIAALKAQLIVPTQTDIRTQIAELERNIDALTVRLLSDPSLSNDEIAKINKEIESKQSQIVALKAKLEYDPDPKNVDAITDWNKFRAAQKAKGVDVDESMEVPTKLKWGEIADVNEDLATLAGGITAIDVEASVKFKGDQTEIAAETTKIFTSFRDAWRAHEGATNEDPNLGLGVKTDYTAKSLKDNTKKLFGSFQDAWRAAEGDANSDPILEFDVTSSDSASSITRNTAKLFGSFQDAWNAAEGDTNSNPALEFDIKSSLSASDIQTNVPKIFDSFQDAWRASQGDSNSDPALEMDVEFPSKTDLTAGLDTVKSDIKKGWGEDPEVGVTVVVRRRSTGGNSGGGGGTAGGGDEDTSKTAEEVGEEVKDEVEKGIGGGAELPVTVKPEPKETTVRKIKVKRNDIKSGWHGKGRIAQANSAQTASVETAGTDDDIESLPLPVHVQTPSETVAKKQATDLFGFVDTGWKSNNADDATKNPLLRADVKTDDATALKKIGSDSWTPVETGWKKSEGTATDNPLLKTTVSRPPDADLISLGGTTWTKVDGGWKKSEGSATDNPLLKTTVSRGSDADMIRLGGTTWTKVDGGWKKSEGNASNNPVLKTTVSRPGDTTLKAVGSGAFTPVNTGWKGAEGSASDNPLLRADVKTKSTADLKKVGSGAFDSINTGWKGAKGDATKNPYVWLDIQKTSGGGLKTIGSNAFKSINTGWTSAEGANDTENPRLLYNVGYDDLATDITKIGPNAWETIKTTWQGGSNTNPKLVYTITEVSAAKGAFGMAGPEGPGADRGVVSSDSVKSLAVAGATAGGGGGGARQQVVNFNFAGPVYTMGDFEEKVYKAIRRARRRGITI